MALFGRREIQRRINSLADMLTTKQLESVVRRLNAPDRSVLNAEWEIVWIAALSRVGLCRYEASFGDGRRRPDVHFSNSDIEFIADVTGVSDQGYDQLNPVDELRRCLDDQKARHGLLKGGFKLTFPSRVEKLGKRRMPKVILPPRAQIAGFVRRYFDDFFREVAAFPDAARVREAVIKDSDKISLEYAPAIRPGSTEGGHLCYDLPYSLRENPIYRGLKEKRAQLIGCPFDGLRGIVICDADCAALGRYPQVRGTSGFNVNEIVAEFFRQHSSIGFIVTVGVCCNLSHVSGRGSIPLDFRMHFHSKLAMTRQQQISRIFEKACEYIPDVVWTPENAITVAKAGSPPPLKNLFTDWVRCRISHSMDSTVVSIPARTVLGVLTGKITLAEFEREFERSGLSPVHFISEAMESGQALEAIRLAKGDKNDDDDAVTFTFRGHDAGMSRFRSGSERKA